jgi:hypothetical protein
MNFELMENISIFKKREILRKRAKNQVKRDKCSITRNPHEPGIIL